MKTAIVISALGLVTLGIAAAAPAMALAQPVKVMGEQAQVTVSYKDLNLTTAAGQTALESRIRHAARAACDAPDQRDLNAQRAYETCVQKSIGAATAAVPAAALVAGTNRPQG